MAACPFCGCTSYRRSYLPDTSFNGKIFRYVKCSDCALLFIVPFPSPVDYMVMYPPSYQQGVNTLIQEDLYKKLPGLRFSYGFQFDLIKEHVRTPRILDYGCGAGNFVVNANHQNLECDGVEFNPLQVEVLRKALPSRRFYSVDEFLNGDIKGYNVIRLSNVLEHLDKPLEIVDQLLDQLAPDGFLLVEGPMETNFNVALVTRKLYFRLRKTIDPSWIASHTPTHMFFSNARNQSGFFRKLPLVQKYFLISEFEWPYPESVIKARGVIGKIQAIIAKVSMGTSKLVPGWGNTFIYLGQKAKK